MIHVIQTPSNPRIQKIRKILKNKEEGYFTIEGKKLLEEALATSIPLEEVFVTEEALQSHTSLIEKLEERKTTVHVISSRLTKWISDVETPPGISAILKRPEPSRISFQQIALFLVSIRDPGNVGTILRSAEAAGCEVCYYSSDCADPFQPKSVRASMGSIFRVPVVEVADAKSFLSDQRKTRTSITGLVPTNGIFIQEWKPKMPLLLCIGSESHGLPVDLPLTESITIPMKGAVESLNAAIAASVCLYWMALQHE